MWKAYGRCWEYLNPGYRDRMRVDKRSQFKSHKWIDLSSKVGVKVIFTGNESHNSLGSGERYHDPLRRIYSQVRYSEPSLKKQFALKLALKQ